MLNKATFIWLIFSVSCFHFRYPQTVPHFWRYTVQEIVQPSVLHTANTLEWKTPTKIKIFASIVIIGLTQHVHLLTYFLHFRVNVQHLYPSCCIYSAVIKRDLICRCPIFSAWKFWCLCTFQFCEYAVWSFRLRGHLDYSTETDNECLSYLFLPIYLVLWLLTALRRQLSCKKWS